MDPSLLVTNTTKPITTSTYKKLFKNYYEGNFDYLKKRLLINK